MSRVVIIDPIFRGSRLFYTQMAAGLGDEVTVLTRTDAHTDASDEAFAGRQVDIREVVTTAKDSWYYHLDQAQMDELGQAMSDVVQDGAPDLLFMSGLDEISLGIADILRQNKARLSRTSIFGVHYTPSIGARGRIGPLPIPMVLRRFLPKGRFARLVREFNLLRPQLPGLRIGLLDERVSQKIRPRGLFQLMPDPPPPAPDPGEELREAPRSQGGDPTLLLVGRQSMRKGFEDISRLLEQSRAGIPQEARIVLCGRLEEDTECHRPLIEASAPLLVHVDRYLSDAEIRAQYETADFVMLPYTPDFAGSSGVLISATSAGAPVIVTDHGLIGQRVRDNGLGFTYPSGDIAALARVIERLPARDSQEYRQMRERCLAFAERNSVETFQAKLKDTIGAHNE